jgi:hypothetical protein
MRVRAEASRTVIERERSVSAADGRALRGPVLHADVLDLLTAAQLEREGARAGLQPLPRRAVPRTREHEGSVVVMLGA